MITEIEIEGFKSLEKVRLKLGKLNLFIGANGSGKSNFFDALRVLQGIGYGFSISEVLNGKPKSATSEVWAGIRGGLARARFIGKSGRAENDLISFRAKLKAGAGAHEFFYSLGISADRGSILSEELSVDGRSVFQATPDMSEWSDFYESRMRRHGKGLPVLHSLDLAAITADERNELNSCVRLLSNMQKLSPSPDILRDYGRLILTDRMGESGENFASLVKSILRDPNREAAYTGWLRELVPFEADKVKILEGAIGEPLFALVEDGRESPAPVLSDGTLRFAALTAAFFQPDMPDVITIEEVENGINPTRLRLLVELLKSQASEDGPQVFATTHSPVILAWLEESDYETTFFCTRDRETGASIIKPLSEIPHLLELARKRSLGELFTQGWMEAAS